MNKFDILCLLIVSMIVVVAINFMYFIVLMDAELDHSEGGINICFINANKLPIIL